VGLELIVGLWLATIITIALAAWCSLALVSFVTLAARR